MAKEMVSQQWFAGGIPVYIDGHKVCVTQEMTPESVLQSINQLELGIAKYDPASVRMYMEVEKFLTNDRELVKTEKVVWKWHHRYYTLKPGEASPDAKQELLEKLKEANGRLIAGTISDKEWRAEIHKIIGMGACWLDFCNWQEKKGVSATDLANLDMGKMLDTYVIFKAGWDSYDVDDFEEDDEEMDPGDDDFVDDDDEDDDDDDDEDDDEEAEEDEDSDDEWEEDEEDE